MDRDTAKKISERYQDQISDYENDLKILEEKLEKHFKSKKELQLELDKEFRERSELENSLKNLEFKLESFEKEKNSHLEKFNLEKQALEKRIIQEQVKLIFKLKCRNVSTRQTKRSKK